MSRAVALARLIGGVRVGVGLVLLTRPQTTGAVDPSTRLLTRTIGVRDVALGVGTIWATDQAAPGWIRVGLVSDVADAVLGLGAIKALGPDGVLAAAAPLPMIAAGVAHARSVARGAVRIS